MSDETGKGVLYVCGAALMALWQSAGTPLVVLFILMLMDTITAMIANGKLKQLSPEAGAYGWRRKSSSLILVLTIAILQQGVDPGILADYGLQTLPAAQSIAGIFAVMEALSVLRNYIYCGGYLPQALQKALGVPKDLLTTKAPPERFISFLGAPSWHKERSDADTQPGGTVPQPVQEASTGRYHDDSVAPQCGGYPSDAGAGPRSG